MLVAIDCEGPLTKNDNALELASHFIPGGDILFTQLSRYDDILAYILKRPGYRAGNTLKLICPFFKAFDVTNQDILRFSEGHVSIINGTESFLGWIKDNTNGVIISTSYSQYISAFCKLIGFPESNTFSTFLDLDFIVPSSYEKELVMGMADRIKSLPCLFWDTNVNDFQDLPIKTQESFEIIDQIFTEQLNKIRLGEYLARIEPVGGHEKATAVKKSCKLYGERLSDVIYIGDSITDIEAFKLVRGGGGLTIAFNGNRYAISNAEIACLSFRSDILINLCEAFKRKGRSQVMEIIKNDQSDIEYIRQGLSCSEGDSGVLNRDETPFFTIINNENLGEIINLSEEFRKEVRGEDVGRLG